MKMLLLILSICFSITALAVPDISQSYGNYQSVDSNPSLCPAGEAIITNQSDNHGTDSVLRILFSNRETLFVTDMDLINAGKDVDLYSYTVVEITNVTFKEKSNMYVFEEKRKFCSILFPICVNPYNFYPPLAFKIIFNKTFTQFTLVSFTSKYKGYEVIDGNVVPIFVEPRLQYLYKPPKEMKQFNKLYPGSDEKLYKCTYER